MITLIFDASPLIHIGKVKLLELLISSKNYIPKAVYTEVVERGKPMGKEDALYIKTLIKKEVFTILECKNKESLSLGSLSIADEEVIILSKQKQAHAVIDELIGRRLCKELNIKTIGSLGLILSLVYDKKITKKEAMKRIDMMIENGWFCSVELYKTIFEQ